MPVTTQVSDRPRRWRAALLVGLITAVAGALLVGLLVYASGDDPPMINGQRISLEMEVRVPAKGLTIEQLRAQDFDLTLVVSASDPNYSDMRWSDARVDGDFIVVPAWTTLNTRTAQRQITAGGRREKRQMFEVALPAAPKRIDDNWSEWKPATKLIDGSQAPPGDEYALRYRVRYTADYSPTPPPIRVIGPTQTPTPESH
jgi:hypothetical protein